MAACMVNTIEEKSLSLNFDQSPLPLKRKNEEEGSQKKSSRQFNSQRSYHFNGGSRGWGVGSLPVGYPLPGVPVFSPHGPPMPPYSMMGGHPIGRGPGLGPLLPHGMAPMGMGLPQFFGGPPPFGFGNMRGHGIVAPVPPFELGVLGKPPTRGNAAVELRNDYCQHFVDTGQRPQNFIRDASVEDRFKLYPKVQRLIDLKDQLVSQRATPPMYMNVDLKNFNLVELGTKFDVILVDPPWEEYSRRAAHHHLPCWTHEEIERLNIEEIADSPSFLFLWCGSGGRLGDDVFHIDQGRQLLRKWGFRRCEDICWLKTNHKGQKTPYMEMGVLAHTKEHCLMGIKGTVRRSTDFHFIHANVDTDVIVSAEPEDSSCTNKPEELYKIIEHFCLGRRRLELFGRIHNIRRGWVTLGNELESSNFNVEAYLKEMTIEGESIDNIKCPGHLVGSLPEIEELRPRSPTSKAIAAAKASSFLMELNELKSLSGDSKESEASPNSQTPPNSQSSS